MRQCELRRARVVRRCTDTTGADAMSFSVRPATFAASLNAYESAAPGNPQVTASSIVSARDDLNRIAEENQEKAKRLQEELEQAKDDAGSGWGVFKSFFGDDSGVAEVSGAGQREEIGAGIHEHTHAVDETYKRSRAAMERAKEQHESSGALFGTIFGGPLIGTHVGSTIAAPEAERGTRPKPPPPSAFVSADSLSWRHALPKDPD
jgi:hypothetical protein